MVVLLGGLLVLATWFAVTVIVVSWGLVFTHVGRRSHGPVTLNDLATAAWWGLAAAALAGIVLAFFVPLGSTAAMVVLLAISAVAIIASGRFILRAGVSRPRWSPVTIALLAAFILAWFYLALAALGPVTHYDAGLYQWAAVQYALDYRVIPGLANLYGPLGYGGAEPILGALLGTAAWHGEGFRLLGGLFLALLGLQALVRLLIKPRSAGTAVLLAGAALIYPPMLWMADFWVTSPTPDLPVLVLAVVAASYLADLATGSNSGPRGTSAATLPTIVVLAALMTALRPTAALLALALVLAAIAATLVRRESISGVSLGISAAVAIALGLAVIARDRMLSGWLQYPASLLAFEVPWRAPDPEPLRTATLGFARDPDNWQQAASSVDWLGPWFARLPQQWEPWWLVAALALAAVLLIAPGASPRRGRPLLLTAAPYALAAIAWLWFSPPAFRFGWGPLFGIASVLLGWALWRRSLQTPFVLLVAVGVTAVALAGSLVRLDWTAERERRSIIGIPVEVVPVQPAPTTEFTTDSGINLRVPVESDQCWSNYPLCTPTPNPALEFLGDDLAEGFVS